MGYHDVRGWKMIVKNSTGWVNTIVRKKEADGLDCGESGGSAYQGACPTG
jgi:hypothetical protein